MTDLGEVVTKIIDGRVRGPSPSPALVQVHVLVPLQPLTRVIVVQLELKTKQACSLQCYIDGKVFRRPTLQLR